MLKVLVVTSHLDFGVSSGEIDIQDPLEFRGNPLCAPVGTLSIPFGDKGEQLYLTKEGAWVYGRGHKEVARNTIENLANILRQSTGGQPIQISSRGKRQITPGLDYISYEVLFDVLYERRVQFRNWGEHGWLVLDVHAGGWRKVVWGFDVPDVMRFKLPGPIEFIIPMNGHNVTMTFNADGTLKDIVSVDVTNNLPVNDFISLRLPVDHPIFRQIEATGDIIGEPL